LFFRWKLPGGLKRARRRDVAGKAERIQTVLRAPALGQPAVLAGAYSDFRKPHPAEWIDCLN
jgi:hypothetical protein